MLALLFLAFLTAFPMPDGRITHYGCNVGPVDNSVTVDAKHVKDPPRWWATRVWAEIVDVANRWTAELPAKRLERSKALKDCDQWMRAVENRIRAEAKRGAL